MFGEARQHFWTDFFAVMEREHKIGRAFASQRSMRPRLPLESPPNGEKGGKDTTCLSRGPLAHAVATEMLMG